MTLIFKNMILFVDISQRVNQKTKIQTGFFKKKKHRYKTIIDLKYIEV